MERGRLYINDVLIQLFKAKRLMFLIVLNAVIASEIKLTA